MLQITYSDSQVDGDESLPRCVKDKVIPCDFYISRL